MVYQVSDSRHLLSIIIYSSELFTARLRRKQEKSLLFVTLHQKVVSKQQKYYKKATLLMDKEGDSASNYNVTGKHQSILTVKHHLKRLWHAEVVYTHVCRKCRKFFRGEDLLEDHVKTHGDDNSKIHKCAYCDKCYKSLDTLRQHEKEKHTCGHCGACFKKTLTLLRHQRSHAPKPHQCVFCKRCFHLKADLRLHSREKHLPEKPYKCFQCEKSFAHVEGLQRHLQLHIEKVFTCSTCGKFLKCKKP